MMNSKRIFTFLLAVLLACGAMLSCSEEGTSEQAPVTENSTLTDTLVTEELDPLDNLNFDGEELHFYVSEYDLQGWGPSDYLIATPEEETGDVILDSVYRRNRAAEELLNVQIKFSKNGEDWNQAPKTISQQILSGEELYDMISSFLFPLASLSVEGYFLNVMDGKYFDFSKAYWNSALMADLAFGSETVNYLLAGDMYMDMIRASYCLYFNKDLYNSYVGDTAELYQTVLDGKWTYDAMLSCVADCYSDLNGNGKRDANDIYGFGYVGKWGSAIPFEIGADLTWIENDIDGRPVFAMNNERSVAVLEFMNELFYHENAFDYKDVNLNNDAFRSGTALFSGCQMLASFDIFRDIESDIGLVPYPKFDENQKNYVTPNCDISNVGAIPMTCTKLDTVSAVLEALCRDTDTTVLSAYYETALKVKYSRDDSTSQMLDIIRGGMTSIFPLAYGSYCDNIPLAQAFTAPLEKKSTDFVSNWLKYESKAQEKLDELWDAFTNAKS